jgi:hypothetical protein
MGRFDPRRRSAHRPIRSAVYGLPVTAQGVEGPSAARNARVLRSTSSRHDSRTLQLYPDNENLHRLSDETRIVVSEPLGELPGAWQPIPESSYGVVQKGGDTLGRFQPVAP